MKRKDIDFSNINYSSFREQLVKAIKSTIQEDEVEGKNAAQLTALNQQKVKLDLQIAVEKDKFTKKMEPLEKKSSELKKLIDKLQGKG